MEISTSNFRESKFTCTAPNKGVVLRARARVNLAAAALLAARPIGCLLGRALGSTFENLTAHSAIQFSDLVLARRVRELRTELRSELTTRCLKITS